MSKISLPKEMLEKEAFKSLPPKEKEEYVNNALDRILQLNPEGITISQIKEATGLTYSTIWHHLEVMSCTSCTHKISRGNLDVYYPIAKLTHLNEFTQGKVRYSIGTVIKGNSSHVCIHESRENRLGNQIICSGISIPFELIDNLIETLSKIKSHLNEK